MKPFNKFIESGLLLEFSNLDDREKLIPLYIQAVDSYLSKYELEYNNLNTKISIQENVS